MSIYDYLPKMSDEEFSEALAEMPIVLVGPGTFMGNIIFFWTVSPYLPWHVAFPR